MRRKENEMRTLLLWLVCCVPLGRFAPAVMGWALGTRKRKLNEKEQEI
jgi:hypothetical protein